MKAMLLGLDVRQLSDMMNAALDEGFPREPMRHILEKFAQANNLPL